MNILSQFISTIIVFISLISSVYASPYISPTEYNNGIFIGIDDNKDKGSYGSIAASYISSIFGTYYGDALTIVSTVEDNYNTLTKEKIDENIKISSILWILQTLQYLQTMEKDIIYEDGPDFFLYISGHGHFNSDTNRHEIWIDSSTDEKYITITDYDLFNTLSFLGDINKWIIIDACNSGGFIDELKALDNISIITSASSDGKSIYSYETGMSYFGMEMAHFFSDHAGEGFDFNDLKNYMIFNFNIFQYLGMKSYNSEMGSGEPSFFTLEDWNIQTYQSPSYAPVPEPSTSILIGTGLAGLVAWRKKMRT